MGRSEAGFPATVAAVMGLRCSGVPFPRDGSRLSIQASSFSAVEGDQGQIAVGCDRERSEKLTLWLRHRGAGDRNGQSADGESPDGEEGESIFEEHGDMKCEEEQTTTTPGLKFRR